ncbi:MAG TPA: hypothetical protein VLM40_00425, partial [Gemmata sp.]|nr:hypothetical protein [Gemmata sp.]
ECPVLASIVGQEGSQAHMNVPTGRIPTYPFPEAPARALGKMASYAAWRQQPPEMFPEFEDIDIPRARDLCRLVLAERGPGWLSYAESVNVLAAFGLPLVPGAMACFA